MACSSALALFGALLLAVPEPMPRDSSLEAFLEAARAATARYHDVEAARIDGFRPVGPDFPGMGEHWVNVSMLLDRRLAVGTPAILSYAPTPAGRRLVGVVYAAPLSPSEAVPDRPVPARYWHEHSGSIDEESLVLHHVGRNASGLDGGNEEFAFPEPESRHTHGHSDGAPTAEGHRLAVVHAWIWLDNPAGTFVTNNWALPYFRVGLVPPSDGPVQAAKMLAFATGAEEYYLAAARALARPAAAEVEALAAVLTRYGERVRRLVDGWSVLGDATVSGHRVAALVEEWDKMWAEIGAAVGIRTMRRLRPLHGDADS